MTARRTKGPTVPGDGDQKVREALQRLVGAAEAAEERIDEFLGASERDDDGGQASLREAIGRARRALAGAEGGGK